MKKDASQGDLETKKVAENEFPSEYSLISKMAEWATSHIRKSLTPEIMGNEAGPEIIAEEISKLIPIDKGYGRATISEQLNYWDNHPDIFETFRNRRESAVELIKDRDHIANSKRELEKRMKEIDNQMIGLPENIGDLTDAELDKMIASLGGSHEDKQIILGLLADKEALPSEIQLSKLELDLSQSQFDRDHRLLTELTSNLDCKLPAVICGQILQNIGWEISLICVDHPEHPSILCTRGEVTYMISFNSEFYQFKSQVKIAKYNSAQLDRVVTYSKVKAKEIGFASDTSAWPLPFSVEGFKKFDNWYVDKVRSKKQ